MPDTPPEKAYRKILVVVVLGVVVLTGGIVFFGRSAEVTLPLSVEFSDLPEHLVVIGRQPAMEAHLLGPSGLLKVFKDTKLTYAISLASTQPGKHHFKISPDRIKTPQSTSVLKVNPDSFWVHVDHRIEKPVPVVLDLRNEPASGYEVSAVTASPSTITLSGPASMLEKITAVRTTPVDLTGLTEKTRKQVALNLNHSSHVQPLEESLINIAVDIKEKTVQVALTAQVKGMGTTHSHTITPDHIELVLRGPENTLKDLAENDGIQVHIDLHGLDPGRHVRPAVIEPPLNTSLAEAKPEEFVVEIFESATTGSAGGLPRK